MNLPLFIARRYFLAKRKTNFINIIALLSMAGVAFATAALVIVLSVFNGIGDLLRSLYSAFDPPLKVTLVEGKSFDMTDSLRFRLGRVEGVAVLTEVIEDHVYLRNRANGNEADMVVTMKGVGDNFKDQHRIDDYISSGEFTLNRNGVPCAVVGSGVRNTLSLSIENNVMPMEVFYVKNAGGSLTDPSSLYSRRSVVPAGVFTIEKSFDENYIFVPLDFAESLLGYEGRRTSLEIKTAAGYSPEEVRTDLKQVLGEKFDVLTEDEQHRDLYRLLRLEKVFTFLALGLLIVVASINIYFSLMMLVIDKRKDLGILTALGANGTTLRNIYITEAFLVSGYGTIAGLAVGALVCWLQQTVGLVSMGLENAVVANYPVEMSASDFLLILLMNAGVTLVVSWHPAKVAARGDMVM
ncbi:MAG: ABC transporter permease [Bacteroidota bacterium]